MANGTWQLLNSFGQPICHYEGFLACNISESSQVLSEPVENGQFATYNKVLQPITVNAQLVIGSDPGVGSRALLDLSYLRRTTQLVTLVMPSGRIYDRLALVEFGHSYSQSEGTRLLVVDLTLQEIRSASVDSKSVKWAPKDPSAGNPVDSGRKSLAATGLDMTLKEFAE